MSDSSELQLDVSASYQQKWCFPAGWDFIGNDGKYGYEGRLPFIDTTEYWLTMYGLRNHEEICDEYARTTEMFVRQRQVYPLNVARNAIERIIRLHRNSVDSQPITGQGKLPLALDLTK